MQKIILFFFCLCTAANAAELENRLKDHSSPYLAMHGHDPVAWQEWNEQAVARAKKENKLLFVSSGYFSCHWCHVMQRESYQDPAIANWLNTHFIPVKVDRELNPSLDSRLIDFVEKTRGYAGWPLNVFVTPRGHPLVGIVYLPAADFDALLKNIQGEWQSRATELTAVAEQASKELTVQPAIDAMPLSRTTRTQLVSRMLKESFEQADDMQGGFGEQSKFPMVPQINVLLDIYERQPGTRLEKFLTTTLNSMASQGLRDQLGGGFFRYAVDPGWQVPHFEKMLYDNALLASLYFRAARVFMHQGYADIGRETLDFVLEQMSDGSGAYIASLSAIDDNNVEGGYYLWHQQELVTLLTADELRVVNAHWQLQGGEDIEGGHHLVTAMSLPEVATLLKLSVHKTQQLYDSASNKMLRARQQRSLPLDNKKLAAWNGLMLSALVAGAQAGQGEKYHRAARQLRDYILENFWSGQTLYRAVVDRPLGDAGLEDAAYLAKGLLDWAQYTGSESDIAKVTELLDLSWRWYYRQQGWQLNRRPLLNYKQYTPLVQDGPMPSPSAALCETSLRLAKQTANQALIDRVKSHLSMSTGLINEQVFWYASYLAVLYALPLN